MLYYTLNITLCLRFVIELYEKLNVPVTVKFRDCFIDIHLVFFIAICIFARNTLLKISHVFLLQNQRN